MLLFLAATALAVPMKLTHQGRLMDATSGLPLAGSHDVTVSVYELESSAVALYTQTYSGVAFDEGYFRVVVDPDSSVFDDGSAWLAIAIDGGTELPDRFEITSVPYAYFADTAENVIGGIVDVSEVRIDGNVVIDSTGSFQGGDTIGGLSGCSADDVAVYDGAAWACQAPASGGVSSWNDLTDRPADLIDGDDDQLANTSCLTVGDVLKWTGTGWGCAPDDDTDTDTDTNLDEAAVDAFVANNGYALDADIAAVGKTGNWADLLGKPTVLDDDMVDWGEVQSIPGGFADGVDDTLTEAQVEGYITNGVTGDIVVTGTITPGTASACGGSNAGAIRFTGTVLEMCDATAWVEISLNRPPIGSPTDPALSCAQLLSDYPGLPSGNYYLDPDSSGAYEAWCDMTTASGGWTLVAKANNGDGQSWYAEGNNDNMTDNDLINTASQNMPGRGDYKGEAFLDLPGDEMLLIDCVDGNNTVLGAFGLGQPLRDAIVAARSMNPLDFGGGPDNGCGILATGFTASTGTLASSPATRLGLACEDDGETNWNGTDDATSIAWYPRSGDNVNNFHTTGIAKRGTDGGDDVINRQNSSVDACVEVYWR